ncbi:hypothetical protein EVAR_53163_1 [Eumeta japonica]|uniref:Uncharacterized protein n=1 Tax=Eumeta variegata TaxID=151549 RepID=A0A4C1YYK3_EUMVA|nr:hypothetical protein EVAR_53163_1 [Eumeta japonica]
MHVTSAGPARDAPRASSDGRTFEGRAAARLSAVDAPILVDSLRDRRAALAAPAPAGRRGEGSAAVAPLLTSTEYSICIKNIPF